MICWKAIIYEIVCICNLETILRTWLIIISPSHNLTDKLKYECKFVGIQLRDDFVTFEFSSEDEPAHNLYNLITTEYECNDKLNIKFKKGVLYSVKSIAFIPTNCHCCT